MAHQNKVRDEAGFYHVSDGVKYPSVTTIIRVIDKPALMFWYAKIQRETDAALARASKSVKAASAAILKNTRPADTARDSAADIGKQAHTMVEWTILGMLGAKKRSKPEMGPEAKKCFESWKAWFKASGLKPVFAEKMTWSDKYHYAGTADCLAEKAGKLYVLDWKSSKGIYPEMHLQTRAYQQAFIEQGHKVVGGAVIRLPKEGGEVEVQMTPKGLTLDPFLAAIVLWKWKRLSEGKDIGDA